MSLKEISETISVIDGCEFVLGDVGRLESGHALLERDKKLISEFPIANPYWLYTDRVGLPGRSYEDYIRGVFRVRLGPVGSFSAEEMAVMVEATLETYLSCGLFGEFPVEDESELNALRAEMMDGFGVNRQVVYITSADSSVFIGGCMVNPGKSHNSVKSLVGSDQSVLPTLSALEFGVAEHPFGEVEESSVVCFTRFAHLPDKFLPPEFQNKPVLLQLSQETVSGAIRVAHHFGQRRGRGVKYGLADVHDQRFVDLLCRYYEGEVLTDKIRPTDAVLDTPLGWHYNLSGIRIVVFDFEQQLAKGLETHRNLGSPRLFMVGQEKFRNLRVAKREFIKGVSGGRFAPMVIPAENKGAIYAVERNTSVQIISETPPAYQDIYEHAKRYNPGADRRELDRVIHCYLEENGLPSHYACLRDHGVVGYFPVGLSLEGKLLLEKISYLPEPLHMMLKLSSSGPLIDEETRKKISQVVCWNVGLSVGFEMFDALMRLGVMRFNLADPDTLNQINQGRHTVVDPTKVGWNKTALARDRLLRYNPYVSFRYFSEGLTQANAEEFFSGIGWSGQVPIVIEEVDSFPAKVLARYAPRQVVGENGELHTIMVADVGTTEVVASYEGRGDVPFGGRVARVDPSNDPYGSGLDNNSGLVASVGLENVPPSSALHVLLERGAIGREIATFPQDRGAVLMAGVMVEQMVLEILKGRADLLPRVRGISLES